MSKLLKLKCFQNQKISQICPVLAHRFSIKFCRSHHFGSALFTCLNMPKENKKLSPGLCWCTFPGRSRTERSMRWSPPSTRTRTGRSATQSLEWVSADCCLKMIFWKRSFGDSVICLLHLYFSITIDVNRYQTVINLPKYLPQKFCRFHLFDQIYWKKPSQCQPLGDVWPLFQTRKQN